MEKHTYYFNKLKRFKKIYGHCDVPEKWGADPELSRWIKSIRKHPEKLDPKFKMKLKNFGFKLKFWDQLWETNYLKLVNFINVNGHSNVPKKHPLYYWVHKQKYFKDQIPRDRIKKLEALNIHWKYEEVRDRKWYTRFKELQAYKRRFGNCSVPYNWKPNPQLGSWVRNQRIKYSNKKMSMEHINMLKSIGFLFGTRKNELRNFYHLRLWEKMFKQLTAFHEKFGHCRVMQKSLHFWSLAAWVCKMRKHNKRGILSESRIKNLNSLGFIWQLSKEERYGKKSLNKS